MWVLMQCMFGISKNLSGYEYITFMKLYDHLYQDSNPLPVPDLMRPHSVIDLSVACLWANMQRNGAALAEQKVFKPRAIPNILRPQLEYVLKSLNTYLVSLDSCTRFVSVLCSFYKILVSELHPNSMSHNYFV